MNFSRKHCEQGPLSALKRIASRQYHFPKTGSKDGNINRIMFRWMKATVRNNCLYQPLSPAKLNTALSETITNKHRGDGIILLYDRKLRQLLSIINKVLMRLKDLSSMHSKTVA